MNFWVIFLFLNFNLQLFILCWKIQLQIWKYKSRANRSCKALVVNHFKFLVIKNSNYC
jgi:hypothetical protein